MIRPIFKFSRTGLISAGIFLSMAAAVFFWIIYSASTNPADSGESGIMLLPFAMPWIFIMPQGWVGPLAGVGSIILNGLIIYLVFGGLRFLKTGPQENKACPHCKSYPLRKAFPPHSNFSPYNLCQDCGNKFTVDRNTARRHMIALLLALPMLGTTIMAFFETQTWLWAMIASNTIFWCYFVYANAKVVFVPYETDHDNDT